MGEGVVELYLKTLLIYPVPNSTMFKLDTPKTILLSRKESIIDLEKKVQRVLNNRLYARQEKGFIVSKLRLWRSLTNNIEEIQELEKK